MRRSSRSLVFVSIAALGCVAALAARSGRWSSRSAIAPGEGANGGDRDDPSDRPALPMRRELEGEDTQARRAMFRFSRVFPGTRLPEGAYGRAAERMRQLVEAMPSRPAAAPVAASAVAGAVANPTPPGPPGAPQAVAWKQHGLSPMEVASAGYTKLDVSSGRATAFASPAGDPKTLYLGTAQGGVWRSNDGGATWAPLTDAQPSLAVGDIALDPAKPGRVWVGTGEGHHASISYQGRGLLLSEDGGVTWGRPAGDRFSGVSIVKVIVSPSSGSIYVATLFDAAGRGLCSSIDFDAKDQGVFRSDDGGVTWQSLLSGPITDLEANFTGAKPVLIAARYADGLHKIVDDGSPPKKLTLPDKDGSPATLGVQIAIAPSKPEVIYAGATITDDGFSEARTGFFRSLDGGDTWVELKGAPDYCQAQCDYDNSVTVDPLDPGTVYLGGSLCSVWKGTAVDTDAPVFKAISMPGGKCADPDTVWINGYVHPDVHALFVHPASGDLWALGDGGVARSGDGGATWQTPNAGLSTLQFYGGCLAPSLPGLVLGGTQDNGFAAALPGTAWRGMLTGDGLECVAMPDGTLVFNVLGGFTVRAKLKPGKAEVYPTSLSVVFDPSCGTPGADGCGDGARAYFAPLASDPANPSTIYTATYRVYRSTEGGKTKTWKPISGDVTGGEGALGCDNYTYGEYKAADAVMDMTVAPGGEHLYTASAAGFVSASHDGGKTWGTHGPEAGLPTRLASAVAIDAAGPNVVWAAFSGFSANTPDRPGHLFRSTDGGKSFVGFEPGGVDTPIDAVAAHPVAPGVVFVGTDVGALASYDAGQTFEPVAANLPNVAVYGLLYDARASRLVAMTFGRGAFTVDLPAKLSPSPSTVTAKAIEGQEQPIVAKFTIVNAGHPGSIAKPRVTSNTPWATVPDDLPAVAGAVVDEVPVTIDASALPLGAHQAKIAIVDDLAPGAPITVTVDLTVGTSKPDGMGGQAGQGGGAGGPGGPGASGTSGTSGTSPGAAGAVAAGGASSQGAVQLAQPNTPQDTGCGCQVPAGEGVPRGWAALVVGLSLTLARRVRVRTGAPRSSR